MHEAWWQKAVVYQIYPKSFYDSTGNGMGDLRGIMQKLDYIQTIGVDVIWLTPVYQSPQNDNGYDISDYYSIESAYGKMADFERLLEETHKRGMKLIMDLVMNHTSTEHEWFRQASASKNNPYRDLYIWKDPADSGGPPNNWQSKFGGPAWQYDDKTGQYYLHLFDTTQADLNWENKRLREKLYDMMRFWAEKGVDGFRLDVINLISKDQQFPDDDSGDGRKYYTDGPRIHEYLHEMNKEVFSGYDMMTVGEMSSTTLENCILYTRPERQELDMTFQFHHLKVDYPAGEKWTKAPFDFLELKQILSKWQVRMHEGGGWNALFWCNHDQPRAVSRFGDDGKYHKESAKMLATTLHMMKGTPYIYQGEEIGMTNPNFDSIDNYRDVESHNAYEKLCEKGKTEDEIMAILKQKSRDNARTPMQWSAEKHAGFSAVEPWIPVAENYQTINAEKALNDHGSILAHYQKLVSLRKEYDIMTYGDYQLLLEDDQKIFAYIRNWNNETLLVVSNFYAEEATASFDIDQTRDVHVLVSNYPDTDQTFDQLVLRPYESVVYQLT
ncbi:trehalose-6-phosphate hydrolase [Lentibacillus halodurans]|uniref:Alpha,alpha-phosphotrehalase n=1 Tax=Lentibacillus halodurans TaxID=237679 RepID=A0A1I0XW43_9BACI|nr:alpha,alpha-phosphotrehalase [Lentibacillus halodurans]SFB04676.1 trehalose-6-phosphate hydrolase [Lentibacillus halodurans]